uniref:DNA gyrase subunit B n=1 Tax=Rhizophora mucronata TaxID=61149 RepID=A0A2P2LWT0_RHIMU
MHVSPSLTCSPLKLISLSLMIFDFFPRLLIVLVKEILKPSICVPPSIVRMLLAYPSIVSEYASEHHWRAMSIMIPSTFLLKPTTS